MILCKITLFIYYFLSLWCIKKSKNIREVAEVGFSSIIFLLTMIVANI
nr:MAG TPA: hypothetical protein [Bacteriophage sp.]